ncbi:MAG: hypothetical protein WA431_07510, partial [Candidatus Cybelea sp.]
QFDERSRGAEPRRPATDDRDLYRLHFLAESAVPASGCFSPRALTEKVSVEKISDQLGDFVATLFEREVSRIHQMQLGVGKVYEMFFRAVSRKNRVVLAVGDERRWLPVLENWRRSGKISWSFRIP